MKHTLCQIAAHFEGRHKWHLALWLVFTACALATCAPPAVFPTKAAPAPLPTFPLSYQPPNTPTHSVTKLPNYPITQSPIPDGTSANPQPPITATPCSIPGQIHSGVFPSRLAGPTAYRVYRPPCYALDGRSYPTLYMLPGNIHTDAIWHELGLDEAAEAAIREETIPPLLIVMPDGGSIANNTSGGPGSYEALVLDELIPFIEATYCAWSDGAGRAIGGLSRGGYWALAIAFRHPDRFASVGGHSAALLDTQAGPNLNPQYTGLSNDLGNLRIYFDIGREDYVIANIQRLHQEMEAAGIAHTWVLNDGRHEDAYWSAHLADYLAWYTAAWPTARSAYPPCFIPD